MKFPTNVHALHLPNCYTRAEELKTEKRKQQLKNKTKLSSITNRGTSRAFVWDAEQQKGKLQCCILTFKGTTTIATGPKLQLQQ